MRILKICSTCKKSKRKYLFYRDRQKSDGRNSRCKRCANAYTAAYVLLRPINRAASYKKWASNNKQKIKANNALRRASRLKATPKWLSRKQRIEMINIYASCPVGFEVDHIVPLRGKNVRGLHVPWNLQHLPWRENRSKSNKQSHKPRVFE